MAIRLPGNILDGGDAAVFRHGDGKIDRPVRGQWPQTLPLLYGRHDGSGCTDREIGCAADETADEFGPVLSVDELDVEAFLVEHSLLDSDVDRQGQSTRRVDPDGDATVVRTPSPSTRGKQ